MQLQINAGVNEELVREFDSFLDEMNTLRSTFEADINLLQFAVSGDCPPSRSNDVYEAALRVERYCHIKELCGGNFPQSFFDTPIAKILYPAYVWLYGEELIPVPQAAQIVFGLDEAAAAGAGAHRVAMHQWIYDTNRLKLFWQHAEPHKKKRMRVLRSQLDPLQKEAVERLLNQATDAKTVKVNKRNGDIKLRRTKARR